MAENYCFCFTHSSFGTDTQLSEKLQDLSQAAASTHPRGVKGRCLRSAHGAVLECVVSESHVCLLLEGGLLHRVRYSEEQPKEQSEEAAASHQGSRSTSPKSELDEVRVPSSSLSWGMVLGEGGVGGVGSSYASGVSRLASRSRMLLRRRGSGRGLASRWPLVPASEVPDSLINQAMAVLQGKSRDAVIRELQRTNLDVNQAVNNLLSRDDDDGGEAESSDGDPLIPAALFPSGDELLSLLGSVGAVGEEDMEEGGRGEGGRGEEVREEIAGRLSRAVLDELGSEPLLIPSGVVSVHDNVGAGRREEVKKRKVGAGKGSNGKKEAVPTPVFFELEAPLQREENPIRFKHIAGLHSELVAVDTDGLLWRWAWKGVGIEPHPLIRELGLAGERVRLLAGRQLRVSAVTESGKVASWLDCSLSPVARVVEQVARAPCELAGETVTQLQASHLFSAVLTSSNKIYWWGMFPFAERKQAVMDVQERLRGTSRYSGRETEVQQGSQVCLRSSPIYTAGTKAIYCKGSKLQCGILQESVFSSSMSEKCRFRVVSIGDEAESGGSGGRTEGGGASMNPPQLGTKRRLSDDGGGEGGKEELWCLHDVIFTDRVQSVRVGKVVKIDGLFAAVHFPGRGEGEPMVGEGAEVLESCRLLRKDDLVPATDALTQQVPHYRQDSLCRLRGPTPSDTALVLACGGQSIHVLFSSRHQILQVSFTLSGRVSLCCPLSEISSHYFLHQATPTQLLPVATNQWLIRDRLGGAHFTSVNAASAMKDPPPLVGGAQVKQGFIFTSSLPLTSDPQNLPPVTTMAIGQCSTRTNVVVVAWQRQSLVPVLLRKDVAALKALLSGTAKEELVALLLEHTSGGCNILHVLSLLGQPPVPLRSPSPSGGDRRSMAARTTPRGGVLREIMKQAMALASGSVQPRSLDPPDPAPWASDEGESDSSPPPSSLPPSEVTLCLGLLSPILTQSPAPLTSLLTERNVEGHTPFMAAVSYKAYAVALQLLDLTMSVSSGDQARLLAALFPSDCHPDDNPVFVLCRNDNCSFTWTGEMHIHQDIFVCRSCGLTDSLCCCTECAYTCHRGHDCVFKKASPTAYCDCWERCRCHSLAQTPDAPRLALLQRLMAVTPLATKPDSSHQSLLSVLMATVAHQSRAQSHWSAIRSSSLHSRSRHEDTPVHNLRPPTFSPKALTVVIENWACVKSAILCGSGGGANSSAHDHTHQLGSVPLDSTVYLLLTKHSQETLSNLLSTIVKHISPSCRDNEAVGVATYFVRSVVRVWSMCELEASNLPSASLSSSRRQSVSKSAVSERACFVFSALAALSVPALLDTALSVITPVTRGVARPLDPLCMSDRHKVTEEMFRLPPVSLYREPPLDDMEHGDGVSGDESEAGDGEESVAGAVGQDASSTATIGSNLLYLSDEQDSSDNEDLESADEASLPGDYRHDDDVIMDHAPSQRVRLSGVGSHWALPSYPPPTATPSSAGSRFSRSSRRSGRSMASSCSLLAQAFSLIVRQIAVVFETTFDPLGCPVQPFQLPLSTCDLEALVRRVWAELDPVWVWLATNMDTVEAQVRHGDSVSQKAPFRSHGRSKAGDAGSSDALEGRREAFSYLLTLLRQGGGEGAGLVPAIDVAGMEHLAWTLDALLYLLETIRPSPDSMNPSPRPPSPASLADPHTSQFFRRSNSTVCLGSLPASPFDPLHEALPLAEKPHLLDSAYSKQQLFGFDRSSVLEAWPSCDLPAPPILHLITAPLPGGQRSNSALGKDLKTGIERGPAHLGVSRMVGVTSHELAGSVLLGRWASTVELFGRVFGETVGRVPGSYLAQERGFAAREREFRREMDTLHSNTHRELSLQVERSRDKLLLGVIQQLQVMFDARQASSASSSQPPLCVYRIKVLFENEPGEGSGVLRSLFTAFSEAVLSEEPLPRLEALARPRKSSLSYVGPAGFKGKSSRDRAKSSRSHTASSSSQPSVIKQTGRVAAPEVEPPLFYQPGKAGFYSINQATPTAERLQVFRGVGRMVGLALLLAEVLPLPLCRHILKFIMMREVAWHDLAFFDPAMYESLRKLIVDSQGQGGSDRLASMGLTFQVSLRAEEGAGDSCELVVGGASEPVTPDNVYQYVKLYAELRMVQVCQDALQALRQGVYDVIPEGSLSSLSVEDLRLVLCGCHTIDTERLRTATVFEDESKKEEEALVRFKSWFWSVVERMSVRERQELLYFWTSSPALPANTESYQPPPSITIRPPDDSRLPTANTCISRLYLPLYSSRSVLRTRLLTALKTKTFGFV